MASIRLSRLFNKKWYLQTYPDVARSGMNPLRHYLNHGWREGRNPSPKFDGNAYLRANPDVAAAKMCPLAHYVYHGRAEGRTAVPLNHTAPSVRRDKLLKRILQCPEHVYAEYHRLKDELRSIKWGGPMRTRIIHELPTITAEHFIPLGNACRPAYWLQRTGLRTCALPFDWMGRYGLDVVANTLKYGCRTWFQKYHEDIASRTSTHRRILDDITGMSSWHTFPADKTIAEYFPVFWKKFDKRTLRFQEICTNARKVCFVFNRNTGMDGIIEFSRNMHKMYPRMKMIMLQVIHSDTEKSICEYHVNRYLTIYTVTDYDIHHKGPNKSDNPRSWIGNINLWNSILSNCHRMTYVKRHIFWKTENIIPKHKQPIEWRVDIKNHGDADNKVIVNMGGAHVAYPSWYTNETGVGASVNAKLTHGDMEIVAVRDGVLKLNFRGPNRRVDGKRFPYWVDYSSIVIDDNEILTAPVATWHDKPFVYEMPVTHGQVVRVKFTQTPHKYTDTELSEFIDLVSQSDEMTPSEIIKLRAYLSDAQK